jgi:hypothetical protein
LDELAAIHICRIPFSHRNQVLTRKADEPPSTEIRPLTSSFDPGRKTRYDSLNRLTSVSYTTAGTTASTTSSLGFTYGIDSSCNSGHGAGCIGQLITLTDGVGSENYTYNNLGQLTQLQKVISGSTYTTSYAYNLAVELTQITYPSGRVVQQSVDAIGRLCEVAASTMGCGTAASPFATGYSYNAAGLPTGFKYGNNIYASFGFSPDRLQLNCLDFSTTNRSGTCAHDGTTKFGLNYSFPAAPGNDGLISGITDSSGTQEAGRSVNTPMTRSIDLPQR